MWVWGVLNVMVTGSVLCGLRWGSMGVLRTVMVLLNWVLGKAGNYLGGLGSHFVPNLKLRDRFILRNTPQLSVGKL